MTQDGIIQKVYLEILDEDNPFHTDTLVILDKFKYKLIKEITHGIRREVNNPESDFYIAPEDAELLIKYLIGETKE